MAPLEAFQDTVVSVKCSFSDPAHGLHRVAAISLRVCLQDVIFIGKDRHIPEAHHPSVYLFTSLSPLGACMYLTGEGRANFLFCFVPNTLSMAPGP